MPSCQQQQAGGSKKAAAARKKSPARSKRSQRGGSQASDAVTAGLSPDAFRFMSSVLPPGGAQAGGSDFPRFRLHHRQEQQQLGGELVNRVSLLPSFSQQSAVVTGGRKKAASKKKKH